jgi:hypothetical protein
VGRVDDTLECPPARPAEPFEARELRLDGDARWPRGRDQLAAAGENGVGGGLGGRAIALLRPPLEPVRIRVEPETDLAAALGTERR